MKETIKRQLGVIEPSGKGEGHKCRATLSPFMRNETRVDIQKGFQVLRATRGHNDSHVC